MPLSTLDPHTALIVIDLQKGIVEAGLSLAHPIDGVVQRTCRLVDAFRAHGLPAALVNVAGRAPGRTEQPPRQSTLSPDGTDLIADLPPRPGDILVTKRTWGAFASTDLEARLRARGVTQVVLAGVATGTGVESTARQAYEQGFHVTLAVDAMTDMHADTHDYCVSRVFPRLGERGTGAQIVELLDRRG